MTICDLIIDLICYWNIRPHPVDAKSIYISGLWDSNCSNAFTDLYKFKDCDSEVCWNHINLIYFKRVHVNDLSQKTHWNDWFKCFGTDVDRLHLTIFVYLVHDQNQRVLTYRKILWSIFICIQVSRRFTYQFFVRYSDVFWLFIN